jgi:hypothetical protein
MALKDISEEKDKLDKVEKYLKPLKDRMLFDFGLYSLSEFQIPSDEGKFDTMTSNRARVEADKIINYLSYAKRKLYIPLGDDDHASRKKIAYSEDCVNGFLYSADSNNDGVPETGLIQSSKSFFRVVRGLNADRIMLYEDDDGNVVCDIAVWDPFNVVWITGKNRLLWVAYKMYDTEDGVKAEYDGWNGKANEQGYVEIVNVIDCSEPGKMAEEGVYIGGEWVREPEEIGLDYIPVRIKGNSSMPLVIDSENEDMVKYFAESYFVANRELYEEESRLLSYKKTNSGLLASPPLIQKYNGAGGNKPPSYDKDPRTKKGVIPQDVSKGQELTTSDLIQRGTDIDEALLLIQQKLGEGGMSNIGLGLPPYPDTAQGTEIIAHETNQKMYPFKLALEKDYEWLASEIVSQYKNGGFIGDTQLEGINSKMKRFASKVKPDDVVTDRHFKCELIPDVLRDRNLHSGMAANEVAAGLISRETARDIHQLVDDPDLESDKIARENARSVLGIGETEAFLELVKDYAKSPSREKQFMLQMATVRFQKALQQEFQPQVQGVQGQPGVSQPMNPQATAGAMRPQPSQQIREAARARARTNA